MCSLRHSWPKLGAGLFIILPGLLCAAPVDGVFSYRQPDGSALQVRVKGDEFFAEEETLDGQRVVLDPVSHFWCYAKVSADGTDLESTGMVASDSSPRAFATGTLPHYFHIKTPKAYRQRIDQANRTRLGRDHRGRMLQQAEESLLPAAGSGTTGAIQPVASNTLGVKHGLTLLIRFSDRGADVTINRGQVDNYCNQTSSHYTEFGNNGSVSEYYADISNGKLNYTNVVADYYTAKHPRDYYTDESIGYGTRASEVIKEALDALEASGFDFRGADGDGNGVIDALNCFYAGPTVNAWSKGLWPHASGLTWQSAKTGIKTSGYQISNMGTKLELGTYCHENGHMLCGFPDVYDYDGDSAGGSGSFDLMDAGCFGGNPCAPNGYLRYKAGWASTEQIGAGWNVSKTLTAESGGRLLNQFLVYSNPANTKEYFLLENRYKNDRDSGMPTGGVAVWHVDEQGDHNKQNYSHQTTHNNYEVALVQADNQRHLERNSNNGDAQDLFYSGNSASGYKNEFSDSTDGGAYDNNAHWWSGTNSGLRLSGFSGQGNNMSLIVQTPGSNYTITASAGANGSISPSGNVSVSQGASATFTIQPSAGYVINSVTVDGANQGAIGSYTFSGVNAGHTISATFSPIPGPAGYTWCAGENGSFTLPGTCDVAFGANGSFNYLYGKTGTITFNNATFGDPISGVAKAGFYKVGATQYTLTASAGAGGAISPSGAVKVNQGANQTFTFTPSTGYTVNTLSVDGVSVAAGASYTFSNIAANHTISVTFKTLVVSTNLALGKPATASSVETSDFPASLAVDGSATTRWSSGYADPSWIAVDLGSAMGVNQVVLSWEAAYGKAYQIQTSTDNQTWTSVYTQANGAGGVETITFPQTTARYVRMVGTARATQWGYSLFEFAVYGSATPSVQFALTASAGANGTINPAGTVKVNQGASQTFTIAPNSGYLVSAVTVDGTSVGAVTSYTFSNVTAAHSISATFKQAPVTQYTLTASADANGSISPSGSLTVNAGASQTYSISAAAGYTIASVSVDGTNQGAIASYTFSNVTSNHTIAATFAKSGSAAWATGVHYPLNALVTYGGKTWKNTFDHTSQADWYPGAPGIWFWVVQ